MIELAQFFDTYGWGVGILILVLFGIGKYLNAWLPDAWQFWKTQSQQEYKAEEFEKLQKRQRQVFFEQKLADTVESARESEDEANEFIRKVFLNDVNDIKSRMTVMETKFVLMVDILEHLSGKAKDR